MAELGPWMPDLPAHGDKHLITARNTYFLEGGYKPVRDLSSFTAAMGAGWKGGGHFKGTGGNSKLIAGSDSGLYEYASGAWTLDFAAARTAPWYFAQFGDIVISANGGAPVKYTLTSSTGALLAGSPPTASMIAIVDPGFVFLAGNSTNVNRVYWSGLEAPEVWTIGSNQCDVQDLPEGGAITGIAGGATGLVFQDNAIHEFAYVGKPDIFTRRVVSREIGAICHGSIAQAGHKTFFLDNRGFFMYQPGGEPMPIGKFRVDRTFLDGYTTSAIVNNLRAAVDPDRSLVIWSMPDRLWIYNWDQDRWTDIVIPGIVGVSTGATSSVTLEDIAVTFPSIEDVTPHLDDPSWNGGSPVLLVAKSDNKLYSFGGTNLEATFGLPSMEIVPGRETHVRNARLIGDATSCTTTIETRRRLGDGPVTVTEGEMRSNGDMPIRASGRYVKPQFVIPAGHSWNYLQGYDLEASAGGRL